MKGCRHMKRSLIVTLVFVLLVGSFNISLAEDTLIDENEMVTESIEFTGEEKILTLEEALEQLLENNITLVQLELAIEGQVAAFDEYESPLSDVRRFVKDESVEGTLNYYKFTRLPEIKEELMVGEAERTLETTKEALKAGVEEAYFGILQAKENVRIQKESMNLKEALLKQTKQKFELGMVAKNAILKAETDYLQAKENVRIQKESMNLKEALLKQTKQKFELGMVAKNAILKAETDYLQAENDFNKGVDTFKTAKMSLNVLLGYEVLENISLTETLEAMAFEKVNIDGALESALEKRAEVMSAYYKAEEADTNFEISSVKYTPNTYRYKQLDANRKAMEESYDKTVQDTKKDVLTKYMAVLANGKSIDVLEKQVALAKEILRIQKVSFELGQNTLTDVQNSENDYKTAQLGLSRSVLEYNISILAFEDAISIGR